ncbi:MAG: flagellin [Spartobacteria bacterium]
MISLNATGAASPVSYHLNQNNRNLQKSLTRLSSGYRINSAVDDPGGLAVSLKLSAAIRRTDAASANVGNALSFLQSQDGVLEAASATLMRMSDLAASSSNSSASSSDIALYKTEFDELKTNLSDFVAEEFNGQALFAAGSSTLVVVTSESGSQTTGITKMDFAAFTTTVTASIIDTTTPANNTSAVDSLDTAIQSIAVMRAQNGAEQSRLTFAQDILAVNRMNLEAANSRIMDVDIAEESTNYARLNIIREAGLAMLAQANTSTASLLRLLE